MEIAVLKKKKKSRFFSQVSVFKGNYNINIWLSNFYPSRLNVFSLQYKKPLMRDSAWKTLSTNNSAFLDATFKKEIVVLGNLNKKDDQKEKWLSDAVQKIHLKTFASANSQSNQFIF